MYVCNDCKSFFDEPRTRHLHINHSELDTGYRFEDKDIAVCPECGSGDIQEAHECVCGHPCSGTNEFCDDCHEDIQAYLEMIQEEMHLDYETLKYLISEHFGW